MQSGVEGTFQSCDYQQNEQKYTDLMLYSHIDDGRHIFQYQAEVSLKSQDGSVMI